MSNEEQYLGWDDIERSVEILTAKILSLPITFSSIDTVSRGGLVPSRLIADRLGIEKIYVDQNHISSDSLFVDDIFDTGDTFNTAGIIIIATGRHFAVCYSACAMYAVRCGVSYICTCKHTRV